MALELGRKSTKKTEMVMMEDECMNEADRKLEFEDELMDVVERIEYRVRHRIIRMRIQPWGEEMSDWFKLDRVLNLKHTPATLRIHDALDGM